MMIAAMGPPLTFCMTFIILIVKSPAMQQGGHAQRIITMPVAIVTGASSGIGKATAEALARAGYRVYGTSRKGGPPSSGVTMLACEVTDQASVDALVARAPDEAGWIDLLVNNAGIGLIGGAEESSIAQVQALFDVNFYGAVRMINALLPIMRRQDAGRILNVGSALGVAAGPYLAHYSASKYALEGYSEAGVPRARWWSSCADPTPG